MRQFFALSAFLLSFSVTAANTIPGEPLPDCSRDPGSLPDPTRDAGVSDPKIPVEHIFVMMQENHSFDNVFGKLNEQGYGSEVDGIRDDLFNRDSKGRIVRPFHLKEYCVEDTIHSWNASWREWNRGKNDGFIKENDEKGKGFRAMGYYDQTDMPYYYALANHFAIGDRAFSSVLGPTYPNRYFLLAGTAFGKVINRFPKPFKEWDQKTIFEVLNENGISWGYYYNDIHMLLLFQKTYWKNLKNIHPIWKLYRQLKKGGLPQVVFVESSVIAGDEHPPFNFQLSQRAVSKRINRIMASRYWKKSAIFLNYDEGGGMYDHVSPPRACHPDGIKPEIAPHDYQADYDRLGYRVPLVVVSPYVKRHYVSHMVYDHTSILKFIETKFNLPALTRRDANANDMMDFFDFENPNFSYPRIPRQKVNLKKLWGCLRPGHITPPEDYR